MAVEAFPADTTSEAAQVQLRIYRAMPPSKRLQLALAMSDSLRQLVIAGVRSRHPEFTPEQVRLAVIRLTLGDELFDRAYRRSEIST
jgi:hypothetical protein